VLLLLLLLLPACVSYLCELLVLPELLWVKVPVVLIIT